jgi:hypothetical protein
MKRKKILQGWEALMVALEEGSLQQLLLRFFVLRESSAIA